MSEQAAILPITDHPRQQAKPVVLPIFTADSLAGRAVPARCWHVENIIPDGAVTLLNGDGGAGKSLLALQLSISTALGSKWIGLPVVEGRCLFLTAEDDRAEVHRRIEDIARETGESIERMDRLHIVSLAGEDALLAVPDGAGGVLRATPLYAALNAAVARIKPALVVLDTLADLFGGDEIKRVQARQFIGLLRGMAIQNNCAVLLLAHPSQSGMSTKTGTSGSTAWNNSVRSRLYLDRVKDGDGNENNPDSRVLRIVKANYGRTGAEIKLRWTHGVFVATDPAPAAGGSFAMIAAQDRADSIFLELLATYETEGRNVTAVSGPTYAPAVFSKDSRAQGVAKRGLADAMNRLFAGGRLESVEFGPPSHRRKRLIFRKPKGDE